MTTTTKPKPKSRRITGVCSTEEYLPEPKLNGALLRLRNDRADFSRVQQDAVSMLSNHNEERVLGNVDAATAVGSEVRFSANLPVGQGVRRVDEYVRDFDAGLRGRFSAGYGITDLTLVGRRNGIPMFDAAWVLTEISDTPKPADVNAKADRKTASWVSEEALASARSVGVGGFTDVTINPGGRIPRWDPLADLDLGKYAQVLMSGGRTPVFGAQREMEWMHRNIGQGFHRGAETGGPVIPFKLLATCGPNARQRALQRAQAGISPEQHLESFMPAAEQALAHLVRQDELSKDAPAIGARTLTQAATSAGAMTGAMVDIAHSLMWLTEMDGALAMMTVVPGLYGHWRGFYGNAGPTISWPGEGVNLPERDPTLVQVNREPATLGLFWAVSTAAMHSGGEQMASKVEMGCEEVVRTQLMRAALSGDDVADLFAVEAEAFDGLLNSAIAETGFGAAITDLGRQDIIDARRRLFAAEAYTDDLGWILSEAVAKQLEVTPRSATGGSDFVYQDGMVDSGARRLPAAESIHLGKSGVTAPAVLLQRSAALLLVWGAGIAMNRLQIPGETRVRFDLQVQASFAMLDPRRAAVIKQA